MDRQSCDQSGHAGRKVKTGAAAIQSMYIVQKTTGTDLKKYEYNNQDSMFWQIL